MPGSAADVRALNSLPLNLPPDSEIYADAYTDYNCEDDSNDDNCRDQIIENRILFVYVLTII